MADRPAGAAQRLESMLERAGRIPELVQQLTERRRTLAVDDPDALAIDLRRAQLMLDPLGQTEDAAEIFQDIVKRSPGCQDAVEGLERALRSCNDSAALVRLLESKALAQTDPARRLAIDFERAVILEEELGDLTGAHTIYGSLAEQALDPDLAREARGRVERVLERATRFLRHGRDVLVRGAGPRLRPPEEAAASHGLRRRCARATEFRAFRTRAHQRLRAALSAGGPAPDRERDAGVAEGLQQPSTSDAFRPAGRSSDPECFAFSGPGLDPELLGDLASLTTLDTGAFLVTGPGFSELYTSPSGKGDFLREMLARLLEGTSVTVVRSRPALSAAPFGTDKDWYSLFRRLHFQTFVRMREGDDVAGHLRRLAGRPPFRDLPYELSDGIGRLLAERPSGAAARAPGPGPAPRADEALEADPHPLALPGGRPARTLRPHRDDPGARARETSSTTPTSAASLWGLRSTPRTKEPGSIRSSRKTKRDP